MGEAESKLLAYAQQNGGVVSRAEALALGIPSTTLTRRVKAGYLVAAGHGIYALPGVFASELSLLRAATTALPAVASHQSAARLHGLEGIDPRQVTVSVPVRRSNRFQGVTVHQLTDLTEEETTRVDGIPVTKPARTILDLAAVLRIQPLAEVLDQAVRLRLTSYEQVSGHLERTARKGKPGVTKLRKVLEPRLGGRFVSDSTLETRLLHLLEEAGLPRPHTQYRPPWLHQMNGRVDLAYVDECLIVEGDSQKWHGTPEAFQADRKRDNLAQLAGWTILRFTWEDITKRPEYVVDSVRRALKLSARRNDRIRSPQP